MERYFIGIFTILCLIACDKSQLETETLESCEFLADKELLSPNERDTACNYFDVYLYNDEMFITCECCECDKAAIPIDCNLEQLDKDLLTEFGQKAKYLLSVTTKE